MQKKMILGRSQLHVKKIHIANMIHLNKKMNLGKSHLQSRKKMTSITFAAEEEDDEEQEAKMKAKKGLGNTSNFKFVF